MGRGMNMGYELIYDEDREMLVGRVTGKLLPPSYERWLSMNARETIVFLKPPR
jgi:hypothetical protein